jgi:anti-anti-sigma factor
VSQLAEFAFEDRGPVLVASVVGEIDGSNANDLRMALVDRLPSSATALVLDLTDTSYLDSSGLHAVFELGRRLAARRQALRLVVPAESPMRRVLELCAVDAVAPLDGSLEASMRALDPQGQALEQ